MGLIQSDEDWRAELEDLESRILMQSGLKPEFTRQTYTVIEMEGKPYQVRTVYYKEPYKGTKKKTIVMTHGYGSNCTTFVTLLCHLAKKYDLVLYDNCGWGLNTKLTECKGLESKQAAFDWLSEFIVKTVDALELPDTFLMAAHSYGCFLTSIYASTRPHRVESLFLISPVGLETYDPENYSPLAYND